jgi:hypothetical protein
LETTRSITTPHPAHLVSGRLRQFSNRRHSTPIVRHWKYKLSEERSPFSAYRDSVACNQDGRLIRDEGMVIVVERSEES